MYRMGKSLGTKVQQKNFPNRAHLPLLDQLTTSLLKVLLKLLFKANFQSVEFSAWAEFSDVECSAS